jgi:hypothetical protein
MLLDRWDIAFVSLFKRPFPVTLMAPLGGLPIVFAYNADLAWGNKLKRIRQDFYHIMENENHWFTRKEIDDSLHNNILLNKKDPK